MIVRRRIGLRASGVRSSEPEPEPEPESRYQRIPATRIMTDTIGMDR